MWYLYAALAGMAVAALIGILTRYKPKKPVQAKQAPAAENTAGHYQQPPVWDGAARPVYQGYVYEGYERRAPQYNGEGAYEAGYAAAKREAKLEGELAELRELLNQMLKQQQAVLAAAQVIQAAELTAPTQPAQPVQPAPAAQPVQPAPANDAQATELAQQRELLNQILRQQQEATKAAYETYVPMYEEYTPEPAAEVPKLFTLSRNDLTDHIKEMKKDGERFSIMPAVKERTEHKLPDYLMCGEKCFAIVFERNDIVFNLLLFMGAKDAEKYTDKHSMKQATYMGDDWYNLIIDSTIEGKQQVYEMLDKCYFHAALNYRKDKKEQAGAVTKAEQMKAEQIEIEKKTVELLPEITAAAAEAEIDYKAELEKFKAQHYKADLLITRKEIATETEKLRNPHIEVVTRDKSPQMPMSLKVKGKTYAMLYGMESGVLMIICLDAKYADTLAPKHPEICRAKFPKGAHWYQLPVDGAFRNKESVYAVLNASREFVSNIADAQALEAEAKARAKK